MFSPTESPLDLQATLGGLTGGNAVEDTPVKVDSITDGDTPPVPVSPSSSNVTYQWQISSDGSTWTNILGATASSYDPTAADLGMHLQVVISYTETEGGGTVIDSVTKSAGVVGEATEVVASGGNWKQGQAGVGGSVPTSTQNAVLETNVGLEINGSDSEVVGSLSLEGVNKGVSVASNSTLTVDGPITVLGGLLSVTGSSTLVFGDVGGGVSGNFIVSGSTSSVNIGGGNKLQSAGPSDVILIAAASTFTNNGMIEVLSGKKLEISGAVVGTGFFRIDSSATLQLDTAESLNVLFATATGLLILSDPTHFTGTISENAGSLQPGDVIDVSGFDTGASISYSGTISGGTVTITEAGHTTVNLTVGANSTNWFITGLDSSGTGILIHDPTDPSAVALDPIANNAGVMIVSDGTILPLDGTINNSGTIALYACGDQTELQISNDVMLQGGGDIVMSGGEIVGVGSASTLTNVDETISGYGQIGTGDGNLTLVNDAAGTIDANVAGATLTLDTGNAITNYGVLEASNGGILLVQDAVIGGTAVIAGGTIEFDAATSAAVMFDNGAGGTTYGVLILIDPSHFTGDISGFAGTAPDLAHSDGIDVIGVNFNSGQFSDSYDVSTGVLTLSDGTNTETLQFVGFTGDINNFHFAEDANGTGTLITDPPGLESSATVSLVSSEPTSTALTETSNLETQQPAPQPEQNAFIAGSDGDHFVFAPGIGSETVANFNWQQDTMELDHFTDAQTIQQLQSLVSADSHGDAVIDLGHNDSVTFQGVSTQQLQQVIQEGHVLLH